jgi:hypothetical protein
MHERAVPVLPGRDLRETPAFYERLGFENRGAPPEEWDYLIVGRGTIELHFSAEPGVDPLTTAASCFLYVENPTALHDQWHGLIVENHSTGSRIEPPSVTAFAIVDPSGNLLRSGTPTA